MFTGLIKYLGTIVDVNRSDSFATLTLNAPDLPPVSEGDSIALNGICLTAKNTDRQKLIFECSSETLQRTTIPFWKKMDRVHVEPALRVGDALGGHFVQGHIDGIGQIKSIEEFSGCWKIMVMTPTSLQDSFIEKGSVGMDGVSLTINKISDDGDLELMIIPHTWEHTIFSFYQIGSKVNLEVDIIAKWVEKMVRQSLVHHQASARMNTR